MDADEAMLAELVAATDALLEQVQKVMADAR
jgi:hypothetical protein